MDENRFLQLLQSLLEPDTQKVKAATAALKKEYYGDPRSLAATLHIMTENSAPELRQLAAVEARKLVPKHWPAIPDDRKEGIRKRLLQTVVSEQTGGKLAQHSTARVISAIAKLDLPEGEWTDLPPFLQQAATSSTVQHREVGIYIIFTLLETMSDVFSENAEAMYTLFNRTIQDPDSAEVRANTMLALTQLAFTMDPEEDEKALALFQSAVPKMVGVLKQAIDDKDEEHTMQSFEVFQSLLGCPSALLNKHFGDLMKFMLHVAIDKDNEDEDRTQAISFLMQAVRYRKLKVQSLRIGEEMTTASLQIVTELGDINSDDEDLTPARSALGLLDIMASSLPPSQVVVPLLKSLGPYFNSSDPQYRRSGILALGTCVEGAPDFIATQLNEILPMVLHLLADPAISVRSAALNGVARLADDLADDMGKEHAQLLPALVRNLDTAVQGLQSGGDNAANLDIIKASCYAIDSLIEGLEEADATRYAPELVPRISRLLSFDDLKVKTSAAGAIGSVASAVEAGFLPYFEDTMKALAPFTQIKEDEDQLDFRAVVVDTMGKIATAVGKGTFEKYVPPLMQASEEGLHLDNPRLKETSYILWGTLAKVYGDAFSPYLDGVVKGLQESMNQDEGELEVELGEEAKDLIGQEISVAGKKVKVSAATDGADNEDDMDEDEDDEDDWDDIEAVSAIAMEKEIAIEMIGEVIASTRRKFMPYYGDTVKVLIELCDHSYEGIRKAAIGALWRAYATLFTLAEEDGMEKWQPGLPLKVRPNNDLVQLGSAAMKATLESWENEMDRGTVTDINRSLAATLKVCGPAILEMGENIIVQITAQIKAILQKKHPCQVDEEDEDDATGAGDPPLEESSEYDWLVIETAMELVTCLSAALGSSFGEIWKVFEAPILKYASGREKYERSTSVGTVAECIGNMEGSVTPYTAKLMKNLMHKMGDEDPETRSNAVYGLGLLCETSGNEREILGNYNSVLAKIEPLLHEGQAPRILDNAAGCVSRMISKHPDKVPVDDVLPRLVELLPLKEDYQENEPVYKMIVQLYQARNSTMQGLTEQMKPVLQKVLGPPEDQLTDEVRAQLMELVKFIQGQ